MTSAPSQASDSVHEVPASNWVRSMTLTPASAAFACALLRPSIVHLPAFKRNHRRSGNGPQAGAGSLMRVWARAYLAPFVLRLSRRERAREPVRYAAGLRPPGAHAKPGIKGAGRG